MSAHRLSPTVPAIAIAVLVLGACIEVAGAQPEAAASASTDAGLAEARRLFEEARTFAAGERWVEALDGFQRSYERAERPATLFNIGAVLVRLGRDAAAIATLELYLQRSEPTRDAAMRADAEVLLASARQAQRTVALTVSPSGASVAIDGAPIPGEGAERSLVLDRGAHLLEVSAYGYETMHAQLPSAERSRSIALVPLDATLVVDSTVPEAAIAIDGEDAGIGHAERTVIPGPHGVALSAEGYEPFLREVSVPPGARVTVDAALVPVPRREEVYESPLFWGLTGGGVAAIVAVAVLVNVLTPGQGLYAGNLGVVIFP